MREAARRNVLTAIFGRKGSGKSTLAREIFAERTRAVALDVTDDFDARRDRCQIVEGWEPGLRALAHASRRERFKLALRSRHVDDYFDFLNVAFELSDYLLIVDEAPAFCSPADMPDEIAALVLRGRSRRIDQLYIAQRPSLVHRSVTAQADVIVSFAQHEPRDLLYLRQACGEDFAARVAALGGHELAAWGELERAPLALLERLGDVSPAPEADENELDSEPDEDGESETDFEPDDVGASD